mgnify:CR=1 FL=1
MPSYPKHVEPIARALQRRARLLVMDEPSAALSDTEIEALFAVIRDLVGDGVPVIYISHRMPEIFAIGDRVTVMRDGHMVGTRRVGETDTLLHQFADESRLQRALGLGQLFLVVDSHDLRPVVCLDTPHRDALRNRHRNDVGQVVLALRIVVAQVVEPGA